MSTPLKTSHCMLQKFQSEATAEIACNPYVHAARPRVLAAPPLAGLAAWLLSKLIGDVEG